MAVIRTDQASVQYAVEAQYGVLPGGGWRHLGFFENSILPDPRYGWQPLYGLGHGRRRQGIGSGKQTLSGSAPGIVLQDFGPLELLVAPDHSSQYTLVSPRSFAITSTYLDSDGQTVLVRHYTGGRVGGALLSVKEGGPLTLDITQMSFKSMQQSRPSGSSTRVGAISFADTPLTDAEPYYFSEGSITSAGQAIAHIRGFELTINNNLQPFYSLRKSAEIDPVTEPTFIKGGKIDYKLTLDVEIGEEIDLGFWDFLVHQGVAINFSNDMIILTFSRRDGDVRTITCGSPGTGILLEQANIAALSRGASALPRMALTATLDNVSFN